MLTKCVHLLVHTVTSAECLHFHTCISMQNVELFREKRSVIMLVFYIVIRITRRTRTVSELSSDQGLRAGAALGAEILNCEAD